MKKIYLVQKMERESFKKWARKGIKCNSLDCYDIVVTMWCESKRNAIKSCRDYNHKQQYEVFFVTPVKIY